MSLLEQLRKSDEAVRGDLSRLERKIYDLETQYLAADYTQLGLVFKASVNDSEHPGRRRLEAPTATLYTYPCLFSK